MQLRDTGDRNAFRCLRSGAPAARGAVDDGAIPTTHEASVDTNGDFNGRTILVTGASGGIGGATVRRLVRAGADVIAAGRT